jgi:hypothetical protein
VLSLLASPVYGHTGTGKIRGTCVMDNAAGRGTMTVTVENLWTQPIKNITPSDLIGSRTGTAEFYVQTFPRATREVLPGKDTDFQWRGRLYGDGVLDLSVEVFADFEDGHTETTGIINCNRLLLGNSGPTPTPGDPTATRTAAQVDPTATRTTAQPPTATPRRPTRTPIDPPPTRTPRPADPTATATRPRPSATSTRVPPTRTATAPRPTRTRNTVPTRTWTPTQRPRPSATATRPQPTSTATQPRPTRTPQAPPTLRPTRTPNDRPPTPTRTPTVDAVPGGSLSASCSLRRNIDFVVITMVVENRTGGDVRGLTASPLTLEPEGGSLFFDRTGPSPGSVPLVRAGVTATFQWTGRLSPGGTMGFSATASGSGPGGPIQTRLIDCGVTGTGGGGFDPAGFSGTCSLHPGDPGTLTLELRNGTSEPLERVEAFLSGRSSNGTATLTEVRGPAPRVVASLSPGSRRSFEWEGRFLGAGTLTVRFEGKGNRSTYDRISTGEITCSADTGPSEGDLPDLGVDQNDLKNSVQITTQNFPADHCAVVEGCVDGTGLRRLLRFNTTTPNYGPGDAFLGDPRGNDTFVYSACHDHYHFQEYADYRLLDMSGNIVARGHKQAFCLVDLWKPDGLRGRADPQFLDCGFQGISAGWADVYHRGLDCQWIDITGVPSGRYVLEVQINPAHVIREHNYSNNSARTEVNVP